MFFRTARNISFYNSADSHVVRESSGVPQSSELGPVLFVVYLPINIPFQIPLYADDCVLYDSIDSLQAHYRLNDSFAKFCEGYANWQMRFNF